jgi:hypothetical protein
LWCPIMCLTFWVLCCDVLLCVLRSEFCVVMSYYVSYVLSSVLWCPLQFPHKNEVRFVFTSSCLKEGSFLIYVICVCLRIVLSNTYCVVFLFSSCVPFVASFFGLFIFDCPFNIFLRLFSAHDTFSGITFIRYTHNQKIGNVNKEKVFWSKKPRVPQ